MKIYSIDFEKVIKNYKNYSLQMLELEQTKISHSNQMDVLKKEMESIIASANSGLIIDEVTQKANINKFKDLQIEASKRENEFRSKFTASQNHIMETSFEEVSSIITEYSNKTKIDMVISKSQLVFVKSEFDITDIIIDILKNKELYYNTELEMEKES